jgi:hypothetical protein
MAEQVEDINTDELKALLLATIRGQGAPTEAELERVHRWAHTTRVDGALLGLVLDWDVAQVLISASVSKPIMDNLTATDIENWIERWVDECDPTERLWSLDNEDPQSLLATFIRGQLETPQETER